jgi:DNA-binding IclR family transcriptional regulator
VAVDAVAVAAPIHSANGQVVAVLSISGPANRIRRDNVRSVIHLALAGAWKLSTALGYVQARPATAPTGEKRGKGKR